MAARPAWRCLPRRGQNRKDHRDNPEPQIAHRIMPSLLQNRSCSVNWKLRPSFRVLVILPKAGELRSGLGLANCGVLKKLIDSARNVACHSDRSVQERASAAFMLRMPPLRNVLKPRLPRESVGAM